MLPACLWIVTPALGRNAMPDAHSFETVPRSVNSCADPADAMTVYQAFSGQRTAHLLDVRWSFVNANSLQPAGPVLWSFEGPAFRAWRTQQPFTVPLFRLTGTNNNDYIFMTGADASTPPIVGGFTAGSPVAWVYNTPGCDSVPLMSAVLASATDHYWTTDAHDHAALLARGWKDGGVVAYVLPPI
ncbi:hypothetical protein CVT24_001342 [Panaeolus cyanescens]|uniref:DUF5648 domain-containing protein n=1 Tax=Panaeolus cyanescens TaxID=181874 RepID=A0A409YFT7_9AGAR|nr:hypothetical protein CVT24_001342 [Panaeolus cyanescens]